MNIKSIQNFKRVHRLIRKWCNEFKLNNVSEPFSSAKWLALHIDSNIFNRLHCNTYNSENFRNFQQQFEQLCQRRLKHEPIQYITGNWEFCGINYFIGAPTLVFRPETEQLVDIITNYVCSIFFFHISQISFI